MAGVVAFGVTVVVVLATTVDRGVVVLAAALVVVVVVVVVGAGFVRPVHGVGRAGAAAFVDEVATTADGTVTVVVGLAWSGLRSASGRSAIVLTDASALVPTSPTFPVASVSAVSSGADSLTLVGCGSPKDGPVAWSSWALSNVVSAIRPANAAMGAITTAAKHPRPLAGSSR